MEAVYEPVDLATLTAELASNFRSAIEKAGMRLVVDCPPLPEPVYVDRDMWEKIVLNLLSNAFKFTLQGEIAVSLATQGGSVELAVRDTGVGIPADELPRLFERFYRAKGVQGRTYEGSGIGPALVQELSHLHGGSIRAHSATGHGSTFTVSIPLGKLHLPADRIGGGRSGVSTKVGAGSCVEEALRWLPDAPSGVRAVLGFGHRHWHCTGELGQDLFRIHSGRCLNHAALWRHRARAGHLATARQADGRAALGGKRAPEGQHIPLYRQLARGGE